MINLFGGDESTGDGKMDVSAAPKNGDKIKASAIAENGGGGEALSNAPRKWRNIVPVGYGRGLETTVNNTMITSIAK